MHEDNNFFKRVDDKHLLDIYIGIDNLSRKTLFYISSLEPEKSIPSSLVINVTVGKRNDSRWGISFTLLDPHYSDVFDCFCNDIVESSRTLIDKDLGTSFIINRYKKWQLMLSKSKGDLLSQQTIKGLIGEIIFLHSFLIPKYGQEQAIKSWIGPDMANQDFVCNNTWYEVKTTDYGSECVYVSSIEQLDMPIKGELVVVLVDKTSKADTSGISLNKVYRDLYDSITDDLKDKLSGILLNLGYFPRPDYDEPIYKLLKIERYQVDQSFPSIKRVNVPEAVINSKYQLSLLSIKKFLIGD